MSKHYIAGQLIGIEEGDANEKPESVTHRAGGMTWRIKPVKCQPDQYGFGGGLWRAVANSSNGIGYGMYGKWSTPEAAIESAIAELDAEADGADVMKDR